MKVIISNLINRIFKYEKLSTNFKIFYEEHGYNENENFENKDFFNILIEWMDDPNSSNSLKTQINHFKTMDFK